VRLGASPRNPSSSRSRHAERWVDPERLQSGGATSVAMELRFLVARNPDPESTLPYLIRLPLGEEVLVFKTRDTWPRTAKLQCHRAVGEWSDGVEVVEDVGGQIVSNDPTAPRGANTSPLVQGSEGRLSSAPMPLIDDQRCRGSG